MAETTGLLNRQAGKLLHGFESRPLRKMKTVDSFDGFFVFKKFSNSFIKITLPLTIFISKIEYLFNKFAFMKIITYFCCVTYNKKTERCKV